MSHFHRLGRTEESVQVRGTCICFVTTLVFIVVSFLHLPKSPGWRTTTCRLSATAYSVYLQLHSTLGAVFATAVWGRDMQWWQGPTFHGNWKGLSHI